MALDVDYLILALTEGLKSGVNDGLRLIQSSAKELAPVRKIYKSGRGKTKSKGGPGVMSAKTAISAMSSGWPVHYGRQLVIGVQHPDRAFMSGSRSATHRGTKVTRGGGTTGIERGGQKSATQKEKIGGSIRGTANSYAPVVQSPVGRIGGQELRHWSTSPSGEGVLALRVIRKPSGGTFNPSDLLSSRGRYEVRTGRGVTTNEEGQQVVGGNLRQGIVVESAVANGDLIYGFVSASAHDPGRKHNYARDQEFGSRHNAAHPFLRPALRKNKEQILNLEKGAIARALKRAKRPPTGSGMTNRPVRLVARVSIVGWRSARNLGGFVSSREEA